MTVQSSNQASAETWWGVAAVLAVGTFAVGTDGFVIAGLLPDVARSLDVGVGAAGQLVTVFAIAYACAAVPLGILATRWSSRRVLLVALLVLVVGNALTALAPSYPLVLVARVVAACGAAVYTATASATAGAVAGPSHRGRAIAIVLFGATSSLVLGAPLGTAVGSAFGWRVTMWGVAAVALLAGVAIGVRMPVTAQPPTMDARLLRTLTTDPRAIGLLVRSFVAMLGIYLPYTYISAVYEPATKRGVPLGWLLLAFGVAASVGILVAGRLADRFGPQRVVVVALVALAAAFAVVPLARESEVAAVVVVAVTGWLSFSFSVPQQHLLLFLVPDAARQAAAAYQAALYAAVSASGAVGAIVLARWGGSGVALTAAGICLVAGAWASFARATPR